MNLRVRSLLLLLPPIPIGFVAETPGWPQTAISSSAATTACRVTHPNGSQPPVAHFGGTVTYSPDYKGPRDGPVKNSHGNGKLWTILWPDGTVIFQPGGSGFVLPDGALSMKWPWYRTVRGKLTIHGRRLDHTAPSLRAIIGGSYDNETGFQSSALTFPSEGCWEVTGQTGGATLTFVTEWLGFETNKGDPELSQYTPGPEARNRACRTVLP
jgi:hypothetical protein